MFKSLLKFAGRQLMTKTGRFGSLATAAVWAGVATGHVDIDTAIVVTTTSGVAIGLRDKGAKREQFYRTRARRNNKLGDRVQPGKAYVSTDKADV